MHQTWKFLKKKKKIPASKRTTLIDEIIKRSRQNPGPHHYKVNNKIRVKGVYHNKARKYG